MKIVHIKKKNFGKKHVEYAKSLEILSNVLNNLGKYQNAIKIYHKILQIKKICFGEQSIEYAQTLVNLSYSL
jgi:tetratricopeptide (TPR) repeat protein